MLFLGAYCKWYSLLRYIFSKVSIPVTWSISLSILLVCLLDACIDCYVAINSLGPSLLIGAQFNNTRNTATLEAHYCYDRFQA